jgi:hypothetical protein
VGWFLLLSAAVLVGSGQLGYWLGSRPRVKGDRVGLSHLMAWQTAVLALLGLLIGFSFAMAVSRFDDRKSLIVAEATAFGTTYLRTHAIDEPAGEELRVLMRRYLSARRAFYDAGAQRARVETTVRQSAALQEQIWSRLAPFARSHPQSLPAALLLQSTNELFDRGDESLAALENRVPWPVFSFLLLVAAVGMVSVGQACGLEQRRLWFGLLTLPLLIALVVSLVYDLAQARLGLIRTGQRPLERLSQQL